MHFVMILSVLLLSLAISSPSNSKSLYIWKDEKGEIHITDQRPPVPIEVTYISPPCDGSSKKEVAEYRKYIKDCRAKTLELKAHYNEAVRESERLYWKRKLEAIEDVCKDYDEPKLNH